MGKKSDNTKRIFLIESLKLFAENGYDSVSVAKIAEAANCSPAALYKHFESKQALFEALLEMSKEEFESRMNMMNVDFKFNSDSRQSFLKNSEDERVEKLMQFFTHTLEDELPSLFRKLLTIEQFKSSELATLYNKHYFESQVSSMESLMHEFMKEGVLIEGNAHSMAIQLCAPGLVFIGVCDREPERKEECLKEIENQIREFFRIYKK